jgi:hypothetical protein
VSAYRVGFDSDSAAWVFRSSDRSTQHSAVSIQPFAGLPGSNFQAPVGTVFRKYFDNFCLLSQYRLLGDSSQFRLSR